MTYCTKARGVLNVIIDGISWRLDSDSDILINASKQEREEMNAGEFGIKERSYSIEGTFRVPNDFPIGKAQELCGVAITVELYDGRIFEMPGAANVATDPFNARQGTLPMRFIGDVLEERVAQS